MKIKSKKIIDLDTPIPVYDITVPTSHNFALANGVIVHNSKDVMDGIVGSYWSCKTAKRSGGIVTVDNVADTIGLKNKLKQVRDMVAPNSLEAKQLDPQVLINFMKS